MRCSRRLRSCARRPADKRSPSMLIDSHVNLHAPQFDADRESVLAVAHHPDIWCTVGTHPHEAKEDPALTPDTLIETAADPRVVGIGETGLDFHYDLSPRDVQATVFRAHIAAARETGLPLVVHT